MELYTCSFSSRRELLYTSCRFVTYYGDFRHVIVLLVSALPVLSVSRVHFIYYRNYINNKLILYRIAVDVVSVFQRHRCPFTPPTRVFVYSLWIFFRLYRSLRFRRVQKVVRRCSFQNIVLFYRYNLRLNNSKLAICNLVAYIIIFLFVFIDLVIFSICRCSEFDVTAFDCQTGDCF